MIEFQDTRQTAIRADGHDQGIVVQRELDAGVFVRLGNLTARGAGVVPLGTVFLDDQARRELIDALGGTTA